MVTFKLGKNYWNLSLPKKIHQNKIICCEQKKTLFDQIIVHKLWCNQLVIE